MPMITMTTRSSMSVKPLSLSFMDFCRRVSMCTPVVSEELSGCARFLTGSAGKGVAP
jgi:hypothetical protein